MSKNKKRNKSNWNPPENYREYFNKSSDDDFKSAHPMGYTFLVLLGITALLLPAILCMVILGNSCSWEKGWLMLGFAGGFIFGIGLFNYVAIIIKQYLGHWVSIISFVIGGILMLVGWLLCRIKSNK